jgi:hypothetical protein
MKTSDILLVILAATLIALMVATAYFGRGSRHGYGSYEADKSPHIGRVCKVFIVTLT